MPFKHINGARIWYEESGNGPETIVFSHGLLMNGDMFSSQVAALSNRFRCIVYDHRGQARSEVTETGYDMDTLCEDAAALIKELECDPCHFVGLSMGGFVGMRLAIRHPQLLKSLVLMDTTADPEPEQNKGPYRRLAFIGRWLSFRLVLRPETSAQLSAVVVTLGASADADYNKGVAVFTNVGGGAMAEASVGGQKFSYEPL